MDREQFFTEIWSPYSRWNDRAYLWTQSQQADPVELAKNGDATEAFNYAQEGSEVAIRPHVDEVWYDDATQLFHWKGPKNRQRYVNESGSIYERNLSPIF